MTEEDSENFHKVLIIEMFFEQKSLGARTTFSRLCNGNETGKSRKIDFVQLEFRCLTSVVFC